MTRDRGSGVALIVCGLALLAVSILELAPGEARGDGDNPADSLRYLAEFDFLYSYSGLALVTGGASLVVGVVGIWRLVRTSGTSLAYDAISAIGVLAGGFLVVSGVMRMQAVGTVPHIQGLDQGWGESAYLVVQIAGTQGLLSAGMMASAAWLVGFAVLAGRRGIRWVLPFAIFPALVLLVLLADQALPFLAEAAGEGLFLGYIAGVIVGIPLCCVGFGIALLIPRVRERLSEAVRPPARPAESPGA